MRLHVDHVVDRPGVDALRGAERTGTTRSIGLPSSKTPRVRLGAPSFNVRLRCIPLLQPHLTHTTAFKDRPDTFLVAMAEGPHPIPSRTRSLSLPAPMVLHG